jgi:hypothetical protein
MYANELVADRSWYTADTAKLVAFDDCARSELHWNHGGMAYCLFDTRSEAVTYLQEHGFNAA